MFCSGLEPKPRPSGSLRMEADDRKSHEINEGRVCPPKALQQSFNGLGKLAMCLSDCNDALGICLSVWCLICASNGKLVLKV